DVDRPGLRGNEFCFRTSLRPLELGEALGKYLAQVGWNLMILELDPALLRELQLAATVGDDAAIHERSRVVGLELEGTLEEDRRLAVDFALVQEDHRFGVADDGIGIVS